MPKWSPSKGIERLGAILELFRAQEEWGVTELATQLGEEKSVTHRHLSTMHTFRLVEQDPRTRRYRLGLAFLELGMLVAGRIDLRTVAKPVMQELVLCTGETAVISLLSGDQIICIDRCEPQQRVRVAYDIGGRVRATVGAAPKVILAHLSPERQAAVIAADAAPPQNPEAFMREVETARRTGIGLSDGEVDPTLRAMAAPLFNHEAEVIGALAVVGLKSRLTDDRVAEYQELLKARAELISYRLGYARPHH